MSIADKCKLPMFGLCLVLLAGFAAAQHPGPEKDPFRGKLFPPNLVLEHQEALALSDQQLADIRAAVIEVQSNIAGHQWDLREAYQRVMSELDSAPIDEAQVMANIEQVLAAENKVKKMQVAMLIRLRNLLTDEQVTYLRSMRSE